MSDIEYRDMDTEQIRLETPHGPIVVFIRPNGDLRVTDAAGAINAPDGPEFIVNRVAVHLAVEVIRDNPGYFLSSLRHRHMSKRHSAKYYDPISDSARTKAEHAILDALNAAWATEIEPRLSDLRRRSAERSLRLVRQEIDKLYAQIRALDEEATRYQTMAAE